MIDPYWLRTLLSLIVVVLLLVQGRRATATVARRRAFQFGAAAFGFFALSNVIYALGWQRSDQFSLVALIGVILIGASAFMLVRGFQKGEMRSQIREAQDLIAEEKRKNEERIKELERKDSDDTVTR
jgi:hypothetical protein